MIKKLYSYRNINDIKEVVTNYDSAIIEKIEKMGIQLHSNYIKENWRIYFASKEYADAIFVKPRNIDPPFKTILFNHSHGGNYDLGKKELIQGNYYLENPAYAEALTQKGYAIFAFDAMGFESRSKKSEGYLFKQLIMEGEVDKNNLLHPITRPGHLKDVFGIEIDNVDTLEPNNKLTIKDTAGNIGYTQHIFKVLKLREARALYTYADQFYEGEPAVSINDYGLGHAVYIGTDLSEDTLHNLLAKLINNSSLKTELEIVYRENKDNKFKFVLNHSENSVDFKIRENALELLSQVTYEVGDELSIPSKDVLIFKIKKRR